jgi:ribosomal protein S19E (S16A)
MKEWNTKETSKPKKYTEGKRKIPHVIIKSLHKLAKTTKQTQIKRITNKDPNK